MSAVVAVGAVWTIDPARLTPGLWVGLAIMLAGCAAMYFVRRADPQQHTAWVAIVPILDILACVPLRNSAVDVLPAAGLAVIFPIGWLAFAFPTGPVVVGVAATALIPLAGVVSEGTIVDTPGDVMRVVTLPIVIALYAAALRFISRDLARHRARANRAYTRLADALNSSGRDAAVLRALVETTDDGVAMFDPDGSPVLVNGSARELMERVGVERLPSVDAVEIYEADGITPFAIDESFVQAVLHGVFAQPHQVRMGAPGDQVSVLITGRPVQVEGKLVGFVLVAHDVTELVHAVDVRDRFLDSVGHEFRTPLTVILGHAEMAEAADPREQERWHTVERAASRLLRMVERLIAVGREKLDPAPMGTTVAVARVVEDALGDIEELAASRDVDLALVGDATVRGCIVATDLAAIAQEITRNAVEFTPPGGSVVVDVREEDDAVLLEVVDTGVGMTAEERSHVFDRFYRTEYARTAAVQGAGLGLSIARTLAESNGAELSITPNTPAGTVATLRIRPAPIPEPAGPPVSSSRETA